MDTSDDRKEQLRDEAKAYVEALPDETATGRMVTDTGEAANRARWDAEEARQYKTMGMSRRNKKSSGPR